jgi:RNA polymerase sigma-70 factor (ECF subfamily)
VAEVDGPAAALRLVEAGPAPGALDAYPLHHAIRADLLERVGRRAEAVAALDAALALTANAAERRVLARRRETLAD